MNNRMYEHPATQANLALLRERGVHVVEPGEGPLASTRRVGRGPAGRSRPTCWPRSSMRPAPGRRCRSTACGCWSRPAAPASRSTRCATSATARAGGWASRWPAEAARRGARVTVDRGERLAAARTRASSTWTWRPPSSCDAARIERFERVRPAADGRRGRRLPRPRDPHDGKIGKEGRERLELRAGADRRRAVRSWPSGAGAGPDADRLRRRARPATGPSGRADKLERKAPRRDRLERHLARRHRLRLRAERGHDRRGRPASAHVGRAGKAEVAARDPRLRPGAAHPPNEAVCADGAQGGEGQMSEPMPTCPAGPRLQRRLRAVPARPGAARRPPLGSRPPCRSRRPSAWSPTRPRSARRSGGRTSTAAATAHAAEEFEAVVERNPVNDYAHFCLGRSLQKLGDRRGGPAPPEAGLRHAPGPRGLPAVPRARPSRLAAAPMVRHDENAARHAVRGADPARERGLGLGRRRGGRRDRRGAAGAAGRGAGATPSRRPARLADKVARLRVFDGEDGRMDRSLLDLGQGAGALCISQFTLYGDTRRGLRPSFTEAARPEAGGGALRSPSARRSQGTACGSRGAGSGRGCRSPCATRGRSP